MWLAKLANESGGFGVSTNVSDTRKYRGGECLFLKLFLTTLNQY